MHEQVEYVESYKAEWMAWFFAIHRCHVPEDKAYANYGGRGIQVCVRWRVLNGFANFIQDMGRRPSKEFSLDRINNEGGYEPLNCRWATRTEQARNRRSNRSLTIDGETAVVAAWSDKSGVSRRIITDRLEDGWDAKAAVFTPKRPEGVVAAGTLFSQWTVLAPAERTTAGTRLYLCRCSCGVERKVRLGDLHQGRSTRCKSCSMKGNKRAG